LANAKNLRLFRELATQDAAQEDSAGALEGFDASGFIAARTELEQAQVAAASYMNKGFIKRQGPMDRPGKDTPRLLVMLLIAHLNPVDDSFLFMNDSAQPKAFLVEKAIHYFRALHESERDEAMLEFDKITEDCYFELREVFERY